MPETPRRRRCPSCGKRTRNTVGDCRDCLNPIRTAEQEIAEATARKAALHAERIAGCAVEAHEDAAANRARVAAMQDQSARRREATGWLCDIVEGAAGASSKSGKAASDRYKRRRCER